MKIITAGKKYTDIDAYASIMAYRELLRAEGEEARAVLFGATNCSVPDFLLKLGFTSDDFEEKDFAKASYIIMDVSNPDFIDSKIHYDQIIEIIDHHPGFEKYWQEYNVNADIEPIGAVCTIIYERIIDSGHLEILTPELAKLLIAGILDNTTNFLIKGIDLERDKSAYYHLCEIADVDEAWGEQYFKACYRDVDQHFEAIVKNDLKTITNNYDMPVTQGQIIVPSMQDIVLPERIRAMFAKNDDWFLNIICLKEKHSVVYCSPKAAKNLAKIFDAKFDGEKFVLDEVVLRKIINQEFL